MPVPIVIVSGTSGSGGGGGSGPAGTTPVEGYTLAEMLQRVRPVLPLRSRPMDTVSLGSQGLQLGDARQRVRDVLRDNDSEFIVADEIDQWLIDGSVMLSARTREIRLNAAGTLGAGGTGTLPGDFLAPIALEITGAPADLVDTTVWWDWKDSGEAPPRTIARIIGATFETYPAATGAYVLRYEARAGGWTKSVDASTTNLPYDLQLRAIEYAKGQGKLKEMDVYAAQTHMALYGTDLPPDEALVSTATRAKDDAAAANPNLRIREIPDHELIALINQGVLELGTRFEPIRNEYNMTFGTGGTVLLPAKCLRPFSLRIGTDDAQFVDDETFWSWKDTGNPNSAYLARTFAGSLEVFPAPASGTAAVLRCVDRPITLVSGINKTDLPFGLQDKAIEYARAQALYRLGLDKEGDRYMSIYSEGLPPIPVQAKNTPGMIDLTPPWGVFDDVDSAHL